MVRRFRAYRANFSFIVYLAFPLGRKVWLIGTPEHGNIGDHAIVMAEKNFLRSCGIADDRIKEITFYQYHRYKAWLSFGDVRHTVLTLHGGGNLGNIYPSEEEIRQDLLLRFPRKKMLIFPQTIYYVSDGTAEEEKRKSVTFYNSPRVTLVAREKTSFRIMQELYPQAHILLTPDIVLSSSAADYGVPSNIVRSGILLCFRKDFESCFSSQAVNDFCIRLRDLGQHLTYTDMYCDYQIPPSAREKEVREKMTQIASASLLITDRLHGMIFAAITGTPCLVLSNFNHKVADSYRWLQHCEYIRFVQSLQAAEAAVPTMLQYADCHYDRSALAPYYEPLRQAIKNEYQRQ